MTIDRFLSRTSAIALLLLIGTGCGGGGSQAPLPSLSPAPAAKAAQALSSTEAAYPNGTPWAVPGTIDFDNYDTGGEGVGYHTQVTTNQGGQYRHDGVGIAAATNAGGGNGFFVGWNQASDWYRYTVNVQTSATYHVAFRVASGVASGVVGTFHVEDQSGKNLTGAVQVPATGSWNANWVTVNATMVLPAGANVLRVVIDSSQWFNLSFMTLQTVEATYPSGTPWALPGAIDFDNYDTGGEGVGYHTQVTTNQGGQYRHDGVGIAAATNAGGGNGFFVGWNQAGDWYRYTVNVQTSATYNVAFRVASGVASGVVGTFHVEDQSGKNLTGAVQVPATGSWNANWVSVDATMALPAGANVLRVVIDSSQWFNLGFMTFSTGTTGRAYSDWTSFGYDLQRTSYNPNETTIGSANASKLHLLWSVDMGDKVDASPAVLAKVATSSGSHNLVLIGAENGKFSALDADTGAVVWSKQLSAAAPNGCMDLGGSPFGITGSAAVDRSRGRVYVADGSNSVFAFNLTDGSSVAGWPVSINADAVHNHVYSGLALNPANGFLYVTTASYCDFPNWIGRLSVINTSTASLGATFFPANAAYGASGLGGGIWGPVSAAIDPASNDVFIATGNDWNGPSEHAGYGEQIVRLNAALTSVLAANYPGTSGQDSDFGSTPMLFTPPGCPAMVAAKNKDGEFVQWTRDGINNGAIAKIAMAPPDPTGGNFIGLTAYSPVTHDVYVGDYANDGVFAAGVDALAPTGPNCTLQLKWKTPLPVGSSSTQAVPVAPPAAANGVVYFGSGLGHTVYALDAASGAKLWSSGSTIAGPIFAAPVIDGILLVGSWDHKLYAFGV